MDDTLIIEDSKFEIHFKDLVEKLTFERIQSWLNKNYFIHFSANVGVVYLDNIDYLTKTLRIIREIPEYEKDLIEYDCMFYDYNISGIEKAVLEIKALKICSISPSDYGNMCWLSNNSTKKLYILDNKEYKKYNNLKFLKNSIVVIVIN